MNLCRRGRKQARFAVALTAAMTAVAALGSASFVLASPLRRMAASTVAFSSDGTRFVAWQNRARPASSYKFEDLTITRQVAADGKPNSGVRTRKLGPIVREPDGTSLNLITRPYEKAFGCLKMSS